MSEAGVELTDRGWQVAIAGRPGGPLEAGCAARGLEFAPIDLPRHEGIRSDDGGRPGPVAIVREIALTLTNALRLTRVVGRADVVHSNSMATHLEVVLATRLRRRRAVAHLHDLVEPGLGRRLLDVIVRLSHVTVAISEAVADCVPSRDRVVVIPNGTTMQPAEPAELGLGDGPIVMSVARLDPMKRHDLLLDAWARVDRPEARLVLVGGPHPGAESYAAGIVERAEALGVTTLGRRDDVPALLAAADVAVLATDREPFGLAVIEAMATRTAVVASDAAGPAEIIEDGVDGVLFEPGDAESLATALQRVIDDASLRAGLIERGTETVERRYSMTAQCDALVDVYLG